MQLQKRLRSAFAYLFLFHLLLLIVNLASLDGALRPALVLGNLTGISLCGSYLPHRMWLRVTLLVLTFALPGVSFWQQI